MKFVYVLNIIIITLGCHVVESGEAENEDQAEFHNSGPSHLGRNRLRWSGLVDWTVLALFLERRPTAKPIGRRLVRNVGRPSSDWSRL